MHISIWNEGEFMQLLNSGLYEDLIHQAEEWLEAIGAISPDKVPSEQNYEVTRRYAAIRVITENAHDIWKYDSDNYYDTYRKVLMRIEEKRANGVLYNVSKQRKAREKEQEKAREEEQRRRDAELEQQRRWSVEKDRVFSLREYCCKNNLDFEIENQKALDLLKKKDRLAMWIESIAALAFIGALIMWIFTAIGTWLVWLPVIIVSVIVFFVADDKIDPKLPDDFFKKINDGSYRFDT